MKYIIVSADSESPSNNMGNQSKYFELGYELAITHLQVKRMKNEGLVDKDDIIVVSKDRAFLYENEFNTMLYSDFVRLNKPENVLDLVATSCERIAETQKAGYFANGRYKYFDEDLLLLRNINYDKLDWVDKNEKFFIVHARFRKWAPQRNLTLEFWENVILELIKHFKIKCYVFGDGTDSLLNEDNIIGVNMREYASLMNREQCMFVVGSMSGGTMLTQLCCREGCPVFVIETFKKKRKHIGSPVFHDESINFSQSIVTFVRNPNNIIRTIKKTKL